MIDLNFSGNSFNGFGKDKDYEFKRFMIIVVGDFGILL